MNLDQRIGMLNSGKFYCFPNGHGKLELIGTLEEVEIALGIRPATVPPTAKAEKVRQLRDYLVTITPKVVIYAGCNTFGEYTITISAASRPEAIKAARQARNETEGRYGVPATYRAKLAEE